MYWNKIRISKKTKFANSLFALSQVAIDIDLPYPLDRFTAASHAGHRWVIWRTIPSSETLVFCVVSRAVLHDPCEFAGGYHGKSIPFESDVTGT